MNNCTTCLFGTARSRDSFEHCKHHALDGLPYDHSEELKRVAEELVNTLTTKKQVDALDSLLMEVTRWVRARDTERDDS